MDNRIGIWNGNFDNNNGIPTVELANGEVLKHAVAVAEPEEPERLEITTAEAEANLAKVQDILAQVQKDILAGHKLTVEDELAIQQMSTLKDMFQAMIDYKVPVITLSGEPTRRCTKCGEVKPVGLFYIDRSNKTDQRTSRCKACLYTPKGDK